MINTYKRGYIIYPMDILVVDDAVFHKEVVFDDFGSIYRIRIFMFENMKPYYSVLGMDFTFGDVFSQKENLTNEEEIYTSKFISGNINSIYKANITKPLYELNTDKIFHGYSGLVSGEMQGVNTYINMNFDDIGRSLKTKSECDIKLCIQNDDDIILYYIHQSFKNSKPIWNAEKNNSEVWKLTEEVLKLENESSNTTYQLVKK